MSPFQPRAREIPPICHIYSALAHDQRIREVLAAVAEGPCSTADVMERATSLTGAPTDRLDALRALAAAGWIRKGDGPDSSDPSKEHRWSLSPAVAAFQMADVRARQASAPPAVEDALDRLFETLHFMLVQSNNGISLLRQLPPPPAYLIERAIPSGAEHLERAFVAGIIEASVVNPAINREPLIGYSRSPRLVPLLRAMAGGQASIPNHMIPALVERRIRAILANPEAFSIAHHDHVDWVNIEPDLDSDPDIILDADSAASLDADTEADAQAVGAVTPGEITALTSLGLASLQDGRIVTTPGATAILRAAEHIVTGDATARWQRFLDLLLASPRRVRHLLVIPVTPERGWSLNEISHHLANDMEVAATLQRARDLRLVIADTAERATRFVRTHLWEELMATAAGAWAEVSVASATAQSHRSRAAEVAPRTARVNVRQPPPDRPLEM